MLSRRRVLSSLLALSFLPALPVLPGSALPALAGASGLKVLAATYPAWLLAREVADGVPGIETDLLVQAQAGCPHDYMLAPRDLMKLASASVLVAVGKGFEPFLADVARECPKLPVLELGADIPRLDLDPGVPGKEAGHAAAGHDEDGHGGHGHDDQVHDHDHAHDHAHGHHHSHTGAGNPHCFASPVQAAVSLRPCLRKRYTAFL